jgi:hypothetical protein
MLSTASFLQCGFIPPTPFAALRAAPLVISMQLCKGKSDEQKVKTCQISQQNGFDPALVHRMQRLVKGKAKHKTC